MKTLPPSKPDWPPLIGSAKITPFIRLRDAILTLIAWILVVALLFELFAWLWDYFSYPIFTLSRTHSLRLTGLLDRIGNFALISVLLVSWLTFWGFVRRTELRRNYDQRPVPPLQLRDHAAVFQIQPEAIEKWRQIQVVVVEFDAANRLENVTAKTPTSVSIDPLTPRKSP